jgi:3'-5' exoribonuclease
MRGYADGLRSPLHHFIAEVFSETSYEKIMQCPAGKEKHGPYPGGLMEHVLGMIRLIDSICGQYTMLDRDLLIAAALVHDIGKVREIEIQGSDYKRSRLGKLVGHLTLSMQMIEMAAQDLLPADLRHHLYHIVVSHHGRQEWGSPVVPMSREAFVFHQVDYLEARLATMEIHLENNTPDGNGFLPFSQIFQTELYIPGPPK